ncbi:Ylh47p [Sugiyamaella lignohabitans]|uniref:Ylh47p n=1 Tax=Sugiyamaella lignohabitans TaxID=796027 RepID=A0A167DGL8_9ASCO|nr:Ylh47p [Sugiyamaella lignohabitans]ANB12894.1 Ylh47p [Sugiyamaella lignohabitans]
MGIIRHGLIPRVKGEFGGPVGRGIVSLSSRSLSTLTAAGARSGQLATVGLVHTNSTRNTSSPLLFVIGRRFQSTVQKESVKKDDKPAAAAAAAAVSGSGSSSGSSATASSSDSATASKTGSTGSTTGSSSSGTTETAPAKVEKKLTIWEKVKHEAQHYWDGTKLLGYEFKVSTKLLAKMAAGYELTRRENRQLNRTLQDIMRLVPFSMFILVPFAELLLPFALKIFPNLLPSTYESGKDKEAKTKKLRKTRGAVSQFLRQTVTESGMVFPVVVNPEQKEQFATFFKQVKSSVQQPSRELLISVARLFKDDVVLDNLSRPQLVAMAKYINIHPYGTSVMLRYSIRHRMRQIKQDDRAIDYEGVESLSVPELQSACASRGIKTYGISPAKLRDDLTTWLELRLHQKVPSTLLILSSAYTYGEPDNLDSYYDGIQAVLSALPEELYHEAELEVSSTSATNKQRLEVLKEQQELIQDENDEEMESGHVIKVRDHLSIEDDEPVAAEVPKEKSDAATNAANAVKSAAAAAGQAKKEADNRD